MLFISLHVLWQVCMLFIKVACALLSLHAIYKVCMCSVKFPWFLLSLHAYYLSMHAILHC